MVFGLGNHHHEEEAAYNSFYGEGDRRDRDYEGNKLHEGLAGAVAFYAMKKYEERREAEGSKDHTFVREMLAAIAGAEIDKFAECEGMEWEDKERAKAAAREKANSMYDSYHAAEYRPSDGQRDAHNQQTYDPNMGEYASESVGSGAGAYGYAPRQEGPFNAGQYRDAGMLRDDDAGMQQPQNTGIRAGYNVHELREDRPGEAYAGIYASSYGDRYTGDYRQAAEQGYGQQQGDCTGYGGGYGGVPPPGADMGKYRSVPGQREQYGRGGLVTSEASQDL